MEETVKWECGICWELHETANGAAYCCAPPLQVWVCGKCEDHWDNEAEAQKCCAKAATSQEVEG